MIPIQQMLSAQQLAAVIQFEADLREKIRVHQVLVFGSAARGESTEDSDLDILVLLSETATHRLRNSISDLAFEVNLIHGTNISIVIFNQETWNSGLMRLTPFYSDVIRDGVAIYET